MGEGLGHRSRAVAAREGWGAMRAAHYAIDRLQTVIWDFNGTLIDDLDLVVRSVNVQLGRRGLPSVTIERYRDVFGFPVEAYYRKIGLDLDAEAMTELSAEFFDLYASGVASCPLHAGIREALERFRDAGVRQLVLSAMEERLLLATLDRLSIAGFFKASYGLDHMRADSKVKRAGKLLRDFNVEPTTALWIGDTDHDAEVAESLGVACVLIARGHQSRARLEATRCPVYDRVADLIEALDVQAG